MLGFPVFKCFKSTVYYLSFQGDTSVVVLIVLYFGVEFLYCLHHLYVFIF